MVDYAPGMRTIIRDEEWIVKKQKQIVLEIKYIDVKYTLPNGQKVKIQSC